MRVNCTCLCILKTAGSMANSVDPDQMQHFVCSVLSAPIFWVDMVIYFQPKTIDTDQPNLTCRFDLYI